MNLYYMYRTTSYFTVMRYGGSFSERVVWLLAKTHIDIQLAVEITMSSFEVAFTRIDIDNTKLRQ